MTHPFNFRIVSILLVAALIPLSCRTYGGHGSEDAMIRQIELATETFEGDLEAARLDLRTLGGEAGRAPALQPLVEAFEQTVTEHEAMVEAHRSEFERATGKRGNYRYLSRTFGGILAEQESVYLRYNHLLRLAEAQTDTSTVSEVSRHAGMRYHVVPPHYERLHNSKLLEESGGGTRRFSRPRSP